MEVSSNYVVSEITVAMVGMLVVQCGTLGGVCFCWRMIVWDFWVGVGFNWRLLVIVVVISS